MTWADVSCLVVRHRVVPTDTQKNTVYFVAKEHFTAKHSIEEFGVALCKQFLDEFNYVWSARVVMVQHGWARATYGAANTQAHNTFVRSEPEQRIATVTVHRSGAVHIESGFQNFSTSQLICLFESS